VSDHTERHEPRQQIDGLFADSPGESLEGIDGDAPVLLEPGDAPLTPEEMEMLRRTLRQDRERRAEEEHRNALWAPVFSELEMCQFDSDWDGAVQVFIHRARQYGWQDDELTGFFVALACAMGVEEKEIRNHCWLLARRS
jgi:hypothetical protein